MNDFKSQGFSSIMRNGLILATLVLLASSCKEKGYLQPSKTKASYITAASVKGADVQLDTAQGYIQVELLDNYREDSLVIELSLPPGAGLTLNSNKSDSTRIILRYEFKAKAPRELSVYRSNGLNVTQKYFKIFVRHLGALSATPKSKTIYFYPIAKETYPIDDGFIEIPIEKGIGSIPGSPTDTNRLVPVLWELEKNIVIEGGYDAKFRTASFTGFSAFKGSKKVKIGFRYGNKEFLYSEPIEVLRAPPTASIDINYKYFRFLTHGQVLSINGGFFLPEAQYNLEFSSQRLSKVIKLRAKRLNHYQLEIEIPSTLSIGSYLVSIYEDLTKISTGTYHVSDGRSVTSIHSIWKDDWRCPSMYFGDPPQTELQIYRGESINVNPFPLLLQGKDTEFNPEKFSMPLQLRNDEREILIRPEPHADECWGDNSFYMYYGRYVIPASTPAGLYEIALIQGNLALPFWHVIEVK